MGKRKGYSYRNLCHYGGTDVPSQWHGSASIVAQNCVAYLFPDVLMTGVFVKPKYLVFMRNVMKYLGIMSVSLACAGPLFATSVQPFAGVTVVQ